MSCKFNGKDYSEGAIICSNGREIKCDGGAWHETGYFCQNPLKPEFPFAGLSYENGKYTYQGDGVELDKEILKELDKLRDSEAGLSQTIFFPPAPNDYSVNITYFDAYRVRFSCRRALQFSITNVRSRKKRYYRAEGKRTVLASGHPSFADSEIPGSVWVYSQGSPIDMAWGSDALNVLNIIDEDGFKFMLGNPNRYTAVQVRQHIYGTGGSGDQELIKEYVRVCPPGIRIVLGEHGEGSRTDILAARFDDDFCTNQEHTGH